MIKYVVLYKIQQFFKTYREKRAPFNMCIFVLFVIENKFIIARKNKNMEPIRNFKNNREELILKHLSLVEKIADKIFRSYNGQFERYDIINIGVIGLIDAIEKYDIAKNASFETYAKWRIKGAIFDELRQNGKISRSQMDKVNYLYECTNKLQHKLLRNPTDHELTEYMNITSSKLNEIYSAIHFLSSISLENTLFSNVDQDLSLKDIIEDKAIVKPEQIFEGNEETELLKYAIGQLKEREQIILNLIYYEDMAIKDIAEILEISSSRVSQLHGKVIVKIRNIIERLVERE